MMNLSSYLTNSYPCDKAGIYGTGKYDVSGIIHCKSFKKEGGKNAFLIRDPISTFLLTIRSSRVTNLDDPGRYESRQLLAISSDSRPPSHALDLHPIAGARFSAALLPLEGK
ncbi:hypothetical protein CDAR_570671 [Caerostris darwini]|uniref:Uncharacterized protein n=1 Tax=Caerostris darwini TaxID=1538125 RepID=A0AAV4QFV0_9ARAC|nr:hypothetical protein CDAR_570671 [Caerostris darwini]